jgi:GNAT superfamily N-acetyltransferase
VATVSLHGTPSIRRADPSETHALAALHQASIAAGCSNVYSAQQINAWVAAVHADAYRMLINDASVLVATDSAGAALFGIGVSSPENALINAVYVAPQMTLRGVGRTLMDAMEALLRQAGAPEARLNATLNSVAFYRSLGYRNDRPTVNRLPSGIELPCIAMSKRLE